MVFCIKQTNRWMGECKMKHKTNLTLNVKYTTTFLTLTLKYTTFEYTFTKILGYLTNTLFYLPHGLNMGIHKDYIPMMGGGGGFLRSSHLPVLTMYTQVDTRQGYLSICHQVPSLITYLCRDPHEMGTLPIRRWSKSWKEICCNHKQDEVAKCFSWIIFTNDSGWNSP
jgi:hypothetical protein